MQFFSHPESSVSDSVKLAKAAARKQISDRFFTYSFASLLTLMPCVCAYYIAAALLFAVKAEAAALLPAFIAATALIGGFAVFCRESTERGSRRFTLIFTSAARGLPKRLAFCAVSAAMCALPPAVLYYIPFASNGGEQTHLVFEILSLTAAAVGATVFASLIAFGSARPERLRFTASFLPHIIAVWLTRGAWLVLLLPYFTLAAQKYISENKKEYPR